MKITAIKLSVFELPATTPLFDLERVPYGHRTRWQACGHRRAEAPIHVLHVLTDEGLEGICTVGDARYQTMRREELEALRIMAVGQDPLDRERLDDKLRWAHPLALFAPGLARGFRQLPLGHRRASRRPPGLRPNRPGASALPGLLQLPLRQSRRRHRRRR